MTVRTAPALLVLALGMSGCFATNAEDGVGSDDIGNPPPPVPPTCPEDETSCEDECQSATDCRAGQVCSAGFDPDRGGITVTRCRDTCVPLEDTTSWCVGNESCCDPEAICSPRGYCVIAPPNDGSTSGEVTASSSGTDSTDTGSSTGDGTSTSTGTTTGTSTGATNDSTSTAG